MRFSYYRVSVANGNFAFAANAKRNKGVLLFPHIPTFPFNDLHADQPKTHGNFSTWPRVNYFHSKCQAVLKLFISRFASRLKEMAVTVDFL